MYWRLKIKLEGGKRKRKEKEKEKVRAGEARTTVASDDGALTYRTIALNARLVPRELIIAMAIKKCRIAGQYGLILPSY